MLVAPSLNVSLFQQHHKANERTHDEHHLQFPSRAASGPLRDSTGERPNDDRGRSVPGRWAHQPPSKDSSLSIARAADSPPRGSCSVHQVRALHQRGNWRTSSSRRVSHNYMYARTNTRRKLRYERLCGEKLPAVVDRVSCVATFHMAWRTCGGLYRRRDLGYSLCRSTVQEILNETCKSPWFVHQSPSVLLPHMRNTDFVLPKHFVISAVQRPW